MFFSIPVAGSTVCSDVVAGKAGATAETLSNNVCQLSFSQDASIEVPSWVTKLSVVAIGGGGASAKVAGGYGGGGGQFMSYDDLSRDDRNLTLTVGSGAALGASTGEDTTIENSSTTLLTAKAGFSGTFGGDGLKSYSYAVETAGYDSNKLDGAGGSSGDDQYAGAGAGTKSAASYPNGGSGVAIKSVRDGTDDVPGQYLDSTLWAIDSEILGAGISLLDFEFGEGGSISSSPQASPTLSGRGGSATVDGNSVFSGGSGAVFMRFSLDSAPAQAPAPAAYSGPLPVTLTTNCVFDIGGDATLSGIRLAGVYEATVDGLDVEVLEATEDSVDLRFPALEAGTYDVVYVSTKGIVTHQDGLTVCATSGSTEAEAPEPEAGEEPGSSFYVKKRFTNYRGDRGEVIDSDRRAIAEFIEANPGIQVVTCLGSTSGVPAIETDEALALARAENACSIVKELVPGVETRLATSTGVGVGQWYRAVSIFARGLFD